MSCGCGGGGRLPASVTLRLEAARLALGAEAANFDTLAPRVFAFVTEGVDVAALDTPPVPLAIGDGPEAVTSRNALINAPLSRIPGIDRKIAAKLSVMGIRLLGELVQASIVDGPERDQLAADLDRYGLRLGMDTDAVREWVMKGMPGG